MVAPVAAPSGCDVKMMTVLKMRVSSDVSEELFDNDEDGGGDLNTFSM